MRTIQLKFIAILIIFFVHICQAHVKFNEDAEKLLDTGRKLFYASVEDGTKLDSAFLVFEQYKNLYPEFRGRAITYIGVLTALRGRHASWVYTKYNLVKKGLKIMDEGIQQSPEDIEALFVYGSTCYFMPFLFGRNDDARNAFLKIIELLPENIQYYDAPLMNDVINFLIEHTKLSNDQIIRLTGMKAGLILQ